MSSILLTGAGSFGVANVGGIDSFTNIMLHADANFTNSNGDGSGQTVTAGGSAAITNVSGQYKWGGGGITLPSLSSYCTVNQIPVYGSANWTLAGWFKNSGGGTNTHTIVSHFADAGATTPFDFMFFPSGVNAGKFRFIMDASVTGIDCKTNSTFTLSDDFHHIELSRNSGNILLFFDGNSQTLTTSTISGTTATGTLTKVCTLFQYYDGTTRDDNFLGFVDDFKLDLGVCRHTSNFTPPAGPYST